MSEAERWLREWSHRLGPAGQAETGTNVGMFRPRRVLGTLRPGDVEQVRAILRTAVPGVTLHPLSTGHNWGLGSREPVRDGAVLLDLRRLDRVRHLDLDVGAAVVEPGVTQGRLAGLLDGSAYMLNVTASSAHTSIVGNALERGVGLRRQRCEDVAGLEVVLADGRLLRLGRWPDERGRVVPYRHEVGPALMPLFTQSSFGVVTAAVIRLLPRPCALHLVRLRFGAGRLAEVVDELRDYRGQRLAGGVLKIYQPGDSEECTAYCCVDGDPELAALARDLLLRRAGGSGLFDDVCAHPGGEQLPDQLRRCLGGDPGGNEAVLRDWFGTTSGGVDANPGTGYLFFLPLLPFRGAAVARARTLVREVGAETGTRWQATVNAISGDVIDLAVSCLFPKAGAARAHQALDLLHRRFAEHGWLPYRLDVDHMTAGGPPEVLGRLKELFDPRGVLAPGRYEPDDG
ncbi:FAD-binding oxidoreductase [Nonomuraea sp. FMUSA5-5]|uniref:FAD-binding oxidoreductase n=1 Tax=Nonomuraea composti TaxID=2720023 RepID=A0ABX1BAL1_9ACTN|nr:FAD-binding oxidoreductase [Nonomuraea sp. FMUSA5-5]